ncbi:peptidoglycan DD-metalloendopeptidase family protein [Gammaproteobacteria bacterium]|nr:peptidoglycan DD-metalloendopeptidase family protein [Gammaproteobacteria bacterium]
MNIKTLLISFVALFSLFACNQPNKNNENQNNQDTIVPIVHREYGLAVDSFKIIHGTVDNGQMLSTLLNQLGAQRPTLVKLNTLNDSIFNVRTFRAGNRYDAFYTNDSTRQLQYFVYHASRVNYVVMDVRNGLNIKNGKRPTHIKTKVSHAVITSSLWNAVVDSNLNIQLALDLSDTYAWSIDFFGIQKGDEFIAYYDEEYVDTFSVGITKIHAACFKHYNTPYYAYSFKNGDKESYFDENGGSLKKAFLKAPLKFSRISSHFTYRRYHPVHHRYRAHTGVDYAAPRGTPVHAIGDGVVIAKGYMGGGGNEVKIRHNSVYKTAYLHLSRFAKGIHKGSHVVQGQTIGYVGSTGASTGPHLDFRVWMNGKPIDPLKLKSPPVEPINSEYKAAFDSIRTEYNKYIQFPNDSTQSSN